MSSTSSGRPPPGSPPGSHGGDGGRTQGGPGSGSGSGSGPGLGAREARDFARIARERARALLELGRPKAALTEAQRALSADPRSAESLQLYGLCLLRLADLPAACKALKDAVAASPTEPHSHYLLGYAESESQHIDDAERCYREALRLAPEEPVYLRALAELLVDPRRKRFAEALTLARKAVALGPERASNHISLGFVASSSGDRAAAAESYKKALALDPNSALAWNNLGCVDLAQGRPMEARARFREALRLDPEGRIAQENLHLVHPGQRPAEIYKSYDAFERRLVLEVWEGVLFGRRGPSPASVHAARTSPVGAPLSPGGFWKNAVSNFFGVRRLTDDPRLHAAALLWATDFRTVGAVWWRMPQLLVWLGVSVGLLRLGPAGLAVALLSNAGSYLMSRRPLSQRHAIYREELTRVRAGYDDLHERWLRGDIERHQRDAGIDRLIDEFCRTVESTRERLHAEASTPAQGDTGGGDDVAR